MAGSQTTPGASGPALTKTDEAASSATDGPDDKNKVDDSKKEGDMKGKPDEKGGCAAGTTEKVEATATGGTAMTEADIREQLAAEAAAKAGGKSPAMTGETPERMASRLQAEAAEIMDLCQLAGCPQKAAGFIRSGKNPDEVRATLLQTEVVAYTKTATEPVDTVATVEQSEAAVSTAWDTVITNVNARAGIAPAPKS